METNTPSPTSLSAQAEALAQAQKNPVVIPHKYRPVVGGLALLIVVFLSIAAGTLLFANYWPQWDDSAPVPVPASPTPTPTESPSAGCYYQQVQCIRAPCPPILVCPSPSSTVPADWKTYTNTEYGFEFKYPTSYTIQSDPSFPTTTRIVAILNPAEQSAEFKSSFLVRRGNGDTLDKAVASLKKNLADAQIVITNESTTTFVGLPARQISYSSMGFQTRSILIAHGSQVVEIDYTVTNSIFGEILSTFRFTK